MKRLNVEQLNNRVELVNKHMELKGSSYNLETGEIKIAKQVGKGIRKEQINADGYAFYSLRDADKEKHFTVSVHHIVMMLADAEEYIKQMAEGMTINHINGNKKDNSLSNLEYLTIADNSCHAYIIGLTNRPLESKINPYQAYEMLEGFYQSDKSLEELSEAFNIPVGSVQSILKGKSHSGLFVMFKTLNKDDVRPKYSKLSVSAVRQILNMYHVKKMPQVAIAKQFNISRSTVGMIVTGHRWSDIHKEFFKEMA